MADLFTNKELNDIATQALSVQGSFDDIISKANDLVDEKVKQKIEDKSQDLTNGIDSIANTSDSLLQNQNLPVSTPDVSVASGTSNNIMNSLNGVSSFSPSQATNQLSGLSSAASIPSIPAVPSVSSAIPGGLSLDPTQYIPEMSFPFSAFVKPLLDKAVSAAVKKLNPSSFISKAEGSLGKLQQKATSKLQNLEQKAKNGLEQAAEQAAAEVNNKVKVASSDLGRFAKEASRQGQKAKKRIENYIELKLLKTSNPVAFAQTPFDRKNDYLQIDTAV